MLKKVIQVAFLFIGGALGLIFLPPLYELINLSSTFRGSFILSEAE